MARCGFSLRTIREKFLPFVALLGVCLAVIIPLLLVTYASEEAPTGQRVAAIVGGCLGAVALSVVLVAAYVGSLWVYARRRRPWTWVAIRVLDAASRESGPTISALGIGSRDGNLIIRLPREKNDFILEGDSFLALNAHTQEQLGIVRVVSVSEDSYLCGVSERIGNPVFWETLEGRMMHDFSSPTGVEFSRYVNQDSINLVRRLIRSWGG